MIGSKIFKLFILLVFAVWITSCDQGDVASVEQSIVENNEIAADVRNDEEEQNDSEELEEKDYEHSECFELQFPCYGYFSQITPNSK